MWRKYAIMILLGAAGDHRTRKDRKHEGMPSIKIERIPTKGVCVTGLAEEYRF